MKTKFIISSFTVALILVSNIIKSQTHFQTTILENGSTRVEISKNLFLDISGVYPSGYFPMWYRVIKSNEGNIKNYPKMTTVEVENFNGKNSKTSEVYSIVVLSEYKDKAILIFGDYYADLEINEPFVIINKHPQSFRLSNFRITKFGKFTDVPIEQSKDAYVSGGAKGIIELFAQDNGSINMNLNIEYYHQANRFKTYGLSFKYTLKDFQIENLMPAEKAITIVENIRKNRVKDSIQTIISAKNKIEEERLFEIKIKNSFMEVAKSQKSIINTSNYNCLKRDNKINTIPGRKEKVIGEMKYTSEGVPIGTLDYYKETQGYTEIIEGFRNICSNPITIKGITKLQSTKGTIYYKDASFTILAGEMSNTLFKLEENYNFKSAEIGSTHYYKEKLGVK